MKRYEIIYNEAKNEGVYALSLVENPAMESTWVALKEQSIKFAEVDAERKLLLGIALIPDKPIYRNDENGEYELIFNSQTIEQVAHNFVKAGKVNNATEEHQITLSGGEASVVQSWIIEDDIHDKTRKFGFSKDNAPIGSWAVMMRVDDPLLFNKAKNGELKGFSIEGLFDTKLINFNKQSMNVESITEAISNGFNSVIAKLSITEPEVAPEAEAQAEPQPTPEASEPEQGVNLAEALKPLFENLETSLSKKFEVMETKLSEQEKTITEQAEKILELSKQPADEKIKSKPTTVDPNVKLSLAERLAQKL